MGTEEFLAEARSYLADAPGYQAIELVGVNSRVISLTPLEGNEKALNLDLSFEKARREAMFKALNGDYPAMTSPVDLVQGGKGLLVFIPLFSKGHHDGYALAVFRISEWLGYVFSLLPPGFATGELRFQTKIDGTKVCEDLGWSTLSQQGSEARSSFAFLGHGFELEARPTAVYLGASHSDLPFVAGLSGVLISLLIFIVIHLNQRSYAQARKAGEIGEKLKSAVEEQERAKAELKNALMRIEWATVSAKMGVWTWDLSTDLLTWNPRMFELFDVPPDVCPVYGTWRNSIHPDDVAATEALLKRAVLGEATFDTVFRCIVSDGKVRYVKATARVERDADGKARTMSGLNWDISEASVAADSLKASEERTRLLLNSTAEAIYGIDLEGNCTFANVSCARILGVHSPDFLLGKNMHRLIHHSWPDGSPMSVADCQIYRAFTQGRPMHEDKEVLWRIDGTSFPAEYWSYPQIVENEVRGAVVTFVDITERRKAEKKIRHMATHDSLTDLPRIPLGRDRLERAIALARRESLMVAAVFLDLDGFKSVNDTYGHEAGDAVLRETARRLKSALRETDTAARFGGDEFLLVLPSLGSPDGAAEVAHKVIGLIGQPYAYKNFRISIGASVGIALYPTNGETVDDLLRLSDATMYEVKRAGKGGFRFASAPPGKEG
jgi:diguanylate cyclase (GGDEF)-like protein/PAS domain S-box-containing protein